ncbi:hypothetical protein [Geomesophilobacter sediminis]|uniref:DUF3311 domain-containing protein n=1 Tax=Geomesophilobacter sediminis TaxID=2798584 RepID=A0A8J7SCZ0_9BACT|nr:hypothetical protein [Geomesophilobacter sediminis]MBJ6727484.1 hypothetical protein [Geomesophilobacter sediminis]
MIRRQLREHIKRQLRLKDTWVILFVLGFIMMNYPFLSIFNKPVLVLDIPLLYLYLTLGWVISITIAYLFARSIAHRSDDEDRH